MATIDPPTADGWMRAGLRLADAGDVQTAEQALLNAIHMEPTLVPAWVRLGRIVASRQRREQAMECWVRAVALQPDHLDARVRLATALMTAGRPKEAEEHVLAARSQQPDTPRVRALAAQWASFRGDLQGAWNQVATTCDPACAVVGSSVALALQRCPEGLALVTRALPQAVGVERTLLLHRMGDLHDAMGQHGAAMAAWTEANHGRGLVFDPAAHAAALVRMREAMGPGPDLPEQVPPPVLIVGLPRSGTSLLEQALACHPLVAPGGELSTLPDLGRWASLHLPLADEAVEAVRATYLRRIHQVSATATVVTDKMPHNLFNLGLLAKILPGCRVLVCERDPLDVGFSCFRQSFGPGLPWATRLEWIAHVLEQAELARAHAQGLPLRLHTVRYASLVTDPEDTLRGVARFLGIPWHPPMLHPERLDRPVATSSAMEVRAPIHGRSVGRAQPYAAWLTGLAPENRSKAMPAMTTNNAPTPSVADGTSPNTTTSSPKPKTGPA